jgi:hypothetical protein
MPEQIERALGCNIRPDIETPSIEPHLAAGGELPENYIVPAWRDCFDADFNPIPEKIRQRILDQGQQPSCVGHGTSVQKSAQEGVLISPRDIFALCKKYDGEPNGWGTTLVAAQDALVNDGAAEDALVDRNPNVPQEVYRKDTYATPAIKENRAKHKGRRPFRVPRTMLRATLRQFEIPVVTSTFWYQQDNAMPKDGIMRLPETNGIAGHCIAGIGWLKRGDVYVNHFGSEWGFNGLFFVPQDGTQNRFNDGYVTLDMPEDVAAIVARYEGKNVRVTGKPEHYRIEGGKSRHYADAFAWFSFGNLFGIDVFEISPDEMEVLPVGPAITIDEAPFEGRELVRQVRQTLGLK